MFSGWDGTLYVNEEVKHRRENPGRAAMTAVAIAAVLFILAQIGLQGVTSYKNLNNNSTSVLVYLGDTLTGHSYGGQIAALALALSVIAATGVGIVLSARCLQLRARQHGNPLRHLLLHHRARRGGLLPAARAQQHRRCADPRPIAARLDRLPCVYRNKVDTFRTSSPELFAPRLPRRGSYPAFGREVRMAVVVLQHQAGELDAGQQLAGVEAGVGRDEHRADSVARQPFG
jgi:hypothetical protein